MKKRILISGLICLLSFCSMHAQESHWQCDIHSFQYDMTVYACLSIDGFQLNPSADYELAAFCGNECRGVASVETISSTGETYYYLRIRSNTTTGETLTFKCFDSTKQCEMELDTTIDFESQGIKGYPSELYMLTGAYTYKIEYIVDSEVVVTDSVKYGELIEVIDEPTKEGYTFSGWSKVPTTMPAEDIIISGSFTINKYLVTFKIGDEVIAADSLEYGAAIVAPDAPVKEGHTFNGWGEVAKTVPASDLTYEGSYTVNSYLLTYTVDGEVVEADSVVYGTAITAIAEPVKEGYTFSGWSEVPATMPAKDVTVSGLFTINKYLVTFKIGDETIAAYSLEYGAAIVAPDAPVKEGHTFDGWGDVAETVPASDLTYEGSYTINSYLITYMVDGEVVEADSVVYGTAITAIAEPVKEGYTFSGWSEIPETMPAKDVTVSGSFTINQYTISFLIDGEIFATDTITYGEKIILPDVPVKEGYIFAWNDEIPETMPAEDIVINGSYTTTNIENIENQEDVRNIYTIDGKRTNELRKGINIVWLKDGSIRKVVVK